MEGAGSLGPMSAHLASAERQSGRSAVVDDDEECQLPPPLQYVWSWFWELAPRRGNNGFGPSPLSYAELESWAAMTGREPTFWEVEVLMRLDDAMLVNLRPEAAS